MDAFSNLTTFDIIILSIITISSLMALLKGFVAAVLSFSNWILSSLIVIYLSPSIVPMLGGLTDNENVAKIVTAVLVFLVSFIIIAIINGQIIGLVRKAGIGSLDRVLGLAFGMVRGMLIGVVIFMTTTLGHSLLFPSDEASKGPPWLSEAKSYNILQLASSFVTDLIPEETFTEAQNRLRIISDQAPVLINDLVSEDLDSNNSLLSTEESQLMHKAIAALPAFEVQQLSEKYGSNLATMTNLEKRAFYREIFRLYEDAAAMGMVTDEQRLDKDQYNELYRALQRLPVDEGETGYKPRQRDDIERLIETIE
jgi:membrane protein required for colicin V production